jgi:hypothetical protein
MIKYRAIMVLQSSIQMLLSKEDAYDLLQPLFGKFWQVADAIQADWDAIPEAQRMKMTPTSKANNFHSFYLFHARAFYDDHPEVTILEKRLFLVGVAGRALLRFKKTDKRLRTANVLTLFQKEYMQQTQLPGIPPEAARLTVGYKLDITGTRIESLVVFYPNGNGVFWDFEVPRPEGNVLPMTPIQNNPTPAPKAIVRAKKTHLNRVQEK